MGTGEHAWRICLSDVDLGPEEEQAVLEVLRSGWLTLGEVTREFESRFATRVGARHAIAVSNGTAALHLALLAAGVEAGDEVIVPALTFVATANAVLYCGARPVFADIESPESLLLDPADVTTKISSRTRAVIPMHYGGYPCDMDAFGELSKRTGVSIIEDACHAPGATWRERPVGSIGDATCFSFFSNKNLVTGEGGMVTTDDPEIESFVRRSRSHGMTALSFDKHRGHAFSYDVLGTGYNYRLTEIESAMGLAQLAKLERNNAKRRGLVETYRRELAGVDDVTVPFAGRTSGSACHLMAVVLAEGIDRTRVQAAMKADRIQTSVHYPPVHRFSSFRGRYDASVPRVDRVAERLVTLPLHPKMSDRDVAEVCESLAAAVRQSG
jgi:dTDP-4-amino-4,6-dideoxygalactose transaminase